MKILVTAGSTQIPIDKVRVISNIFKGNTGRAIAEYYSFEQGHDVTLLSSANPVDYSFERSKVFQWKSFQTFDDLKKLMETEITQNKYDVIIHSAAISDYELSNVLIEDPSVPNGLAVACRGSKISSQYKRIYLEMVPTIKLVDQIRKPWGFEGKLVKFKLQVGISDTELLDIAWKSMHTSKADCIVANCLEWAKERAYILTPDGQCETVTRADLPRALHERLAV